MGSTGSSYVKGRPAPARLNGRSFGLCWNSGQNDLHIEFLVLLLCGGGGVVGCCIVETTNIVSSLAVAKEFWGRKSSLSF